MNKKLILLFLVIIIPSAVLSQSFFLDYESVRLIRSNLEYLASDMLGGREATTSGEDLAAEFISGKLSEYGIKPYCDEGTYFQKFDVNVKRTDSLSYLELFSVDDSTYRFHPGEDFYLSTAILPSAEFNEIESEIVFAGFGITAPAYEYDDYKDIDASGKVVLIYWNVPDSDGESIFSEEDSKKFGDPKYKVKNAEEHGAVGVLVIPGKWAVDNWEWLKREALSPSFTLYDTSAAFDRSVPYVMLSGKALSSLLEREKYSYKELMEFLNDEEIPDWFLLSKKVKFSFKAEIEKRSSKNIIGIIEGIDEKLKTEFVTMGAHYDHEGIVKGEIYNGADDNASGTAAVLETARRLARLKQNKRSILFIFHAAEEKGLLGSRYLTAHSNFMDDIVVNINVDMVGREHIDTIYSVGSGKLSSELKDIVEDVNRETVNFSFNYLFDNPDDPQKIYYRSDHYNYAKHGIPIVFFYDYMLEDYHKPTDDADKINFEKIEKVSTLLTGIALRIANLDHRLILNETESLHSQ